MRSRCNAPLIPSRPFLTVLSVLFSLMLLGCGGGESNVVSGNRDGVLHYGNGAEPQGLDPHVVTGVPENHIIRALFAKGNHVPYNPALTATVTINVK